MSIIIRIITGVLQDNDNNSYDHVVIVYVILASGSVLVATVLSINTCLGFRTSCHYSIHR